MAFKASRRIHVSSLAKQAPVSPAFIATDQGGVVPASADLSKAGSLDGRTIIRFAHAFETGGGVERYLDDLDRILLARNAVTIFRLFIGGNTCSAEPHAEAVGRGSLLRVPLPLPAGEGPQIASDRSLMGVKWKHLIRDWVIYNPLIWKFLAKRYLVSWRIPRRSGQVIGAGRTVADLLSHHRVDLIMLHFFGGADADEIVSEACRTDTPFAVLNHFSNERFLNLSSRKHTMLASGVAGVNGLGLPRFIRKEFCNLSDGIDTEYFHLSKACPPPEAPALPLVLLPARVIRSKGHLDLLKAAAILKREGIAFAIAFAGRADSKPFNDKLRRIVDGFGMAGHVHFLGELSVERLRDWYGASAVVAFPTYHHEGLPRVTLEAQAMQVPVIAYATGGVAAGILSGKTGYLLKTGDAKGLSLRLRELLTDAAKRKEMGESGRRWVADRFSLCSLAQRHEEFYLRVIRSRNADVPPIKP